MPPAEKIAQNSGSLEGTHRDSSRSGQAIRKMTSTTIEAAAKSA